MDGNWVAFYIKEVVLIFYFLYGSLTANHFLSQQEVPLGAGDRWQPLPSPTSLLPGAQLPLHSLLQGDGEKQRERWGLRPGPDLGTLSAALTFSPL